MSWTVIGEGHKPGYVRVRCTCGATAMRTAANVARGGGCRPCWIREMKARRGRKANEASVVARRSKES